jgi:hypothetical protein
VESLSDAVIVTSYRLSVDESERPNGPIWDYNGVGMLTRSASNLSAPLALRDLLHYCVCALAITTGLFFWGLTVASHLVQISLSFEWLVAFWTCFAAILVLEVLSRPSSSLISVIGLSALVGPFLVVPSIAGLSIRTVFHYLACALGISIGVVAFASSALGILFGVWPESPLGGVIFWLTFGAIFAWELVYRPATSITAGIGACALIVLMAGFLAYVIVVDAYAFS